MGFKKWLRSAQADTPAYPPMRVTSSSRAGGHGPTHAPRGSKLAATRADAVAASTIAHYRAELFQIRGMLDDALAHFDREPHEYGLTLAIRGYRARLAEGLELYFAAAGSRSVREIEPVVDCVERVDLRLSSLDEEICAEVERFEVAAGDIARYVRPGAPEAARRRYADEANELLLELGLYRQSWSCALQEKETDRLNTVETILRSILDTAPTTPSAPPPPLTRSLDGGLEMAVVSSSSATNSCSSPSLSSSSDGTYASIMRPQEAYNGSGARHHAQQQPGGRGRIDSSTPDTSLVSDDQNHRRRRRRHRHGSNTPGSSSLSLSPPLSPAPPSTTPPTLSPSSSHPPVTPPSLRARRFGITVSPRRSKEDGRRQGRQRAAYGTDQPTDGLRLSQQKREDRVGGAEDERRRRDRADRYDRRGDAAVYPGSSARSNNLDRATSPTAQGRADVNGNGSGMLVLSRSRTLRDMAALACSTEDLDPSKSTEFHATSAAESMYPDATYAEYAQAAAEEKPAYVGDLKLNASVDHDEKEAPEQPGSELAPGKSFASILYTTQNVRSEALSDEGMVFQPFRVRGDGRCLFRSVARSREVNRGHHNMSERAEREMADDLRVISVRELKKHRALLTQFYVIETDFARYTKRMSNPRTFGGEPELLVLAKILHCPIAVYIQVNGRYKQIQVYGRQYRSEPCRILYSDGVHYDALLVKSRPGGRR